MNLKTLVRKRLIENDVLKEHLAKYDGVPAVFDTEAPPDQEKGWGRKTQYPRCTYVIDMQANEERSSVGTMDVTVYAVNDSMLILALTAAIKDSFRDIILNPEGDDGPYSFAWSRTEGFAIESTNIIGQTIEFDLMEYPKQETTDPDPQLTVSQFAKDIYPDAVVLGMDRIGDVTDSSLAPVIYVEIQSLTKTTGHNMNQVTWFNCEMTIHVLYPVQSDNIKLCAGMTQVFSKAEYLIMDDGSQMDVNRVQFDRKADYLRSGQITLNGKYGVVKTSPLEHRMFKAMKTHIFNGGT